MYSEIIVKILGSRYTLLSYQPGTHPSIFYGSSIKLPEVRVRGH